MPNTVAYAWVDDSREEGQFSCLRMSLSWSALYGGRIFSSPSCLDPRVEIANLRSLEIDEDTAFCRSSLILEVIKDVIAGFVGQLVYLVQDDDDDAIGIVDLPAICCTPFRCSSR